MMNQKEPEIPHNFSDYATTDAYVKQLLNSPASAAAMDKEMARIKKHFADDERDNIRFAAALGVIILLAVAVLAI